VVDRHGLGQQHNTALGGAVGDRPVTPHDTPAGTVVDDHAPALRDHGGQRGLRHQEGAFQVDINLLVPFFLGALERVVRVEDAGVVEEDVEAAECAHGFANGAHALGGSANIGAEEDRLAA
jgi:hypothetical protein